MPPEVGARGATGYAYSHADLIHASHGSAPMQGAARGNSAAPQIQLQDTAPAHHALYRHDPGQLQEKMHAAGPMHRMDVILARLDTMIENLRQVYFPAPPGNCLAADANHAPQPYHQPYHQPEQSKTRMAYAVNRAYDKPKSTRYRFGMGALAGAGVAAGTFGLMRLGGMGLLGVSTLFGVASIGFLGAGLYGAYKFHSKLLSSHQNYYQPQLPPHGENVGLWKLGDYSPASNMRGPHV